MDRLMKILTSRTVWVLVALFVLNGVQALVPFMPVWLQDLANGVLPILGVYFRTNPSVNLMQKKNETP